MDIQPGELPFLGRTPHAGNSRLCSVYNSLQGSEQISLRAADGTNVNAIYDLRGGRKRWQKPVGRPIQSVRMYTTGRGKAKAPNQQSSHSTSSTSISRGYKQKPRIPAGGAQPRTATTACRTPGATHVFLERGHSCPPDLDQLLEADKNVRAPGKRELRPVCGGAATKAQRDRKIEDTKMYRVPFPFLQSSCLYAFLWPG